MFIGRIFVGILLLLIFIFSVFCLSNFVFQLLTLVILFFLLIEWLNILELNSIFYKILYILITLLFGYFVVKYNLIFKKILYLNLCIWIIGFISIIFYMKLKFIFRKKIIGFFLGFLIFIPWWYSLNYLYSTSSYFKLDLFFVCTLVIMSDISAFFFGYIWGKKKLAQNISPGKTWFGVFGAALSTLFIVLIFLFIFNINVNMILSYVLFSYIILFVSIIGDLLESVFKRNMGLKNSSKLLLYHGGFLDRFDSILSAIPVFVLLFKI